MFWLLRSKETHSDLKSNEMPFQIYGLGIFLKPCERALPKNTHMYKDNKLLQVTVCATEPFILHTNCQGLFMSLPTVTLRFMAQMSQGSCIRCQSTLLCIRGGTLAHVTPREVSDVNRREGEMMPYKKLRLWSGNSTGPGHYLAQYAKFGIQNLRITFPLLWGGGQ